MISKYTSKFIFASRYFEPWISVAVGIGSQNPANADGGGEEGRPPGDPEPEVEGDQGPQGGARRMVETAAHLVDHVFPRVPIRQWVLSFPWPLRLLFAARPDVLTRVLTVVTRALSTAVVKRAGLTRSAGAETGIVTFIQRFGSALNLNVHCHLLVPDGAYTFAHDKPHFHRAPAPSPTELHELLNTLIARITRTLVRGGVLIEEPEHPYLDLELNSPLEQLSAAAVRYRIAVGPQAGRKTMTLRNPGAMVDEATSSKPFTAARDGVAINAAVGCGSFE